MHGRHLTLFFIVALCLPVAAQEAGSQSVEPWPWIDPPGAESITLLLMGDTNIQNRADPGNAYQYVLPTLQAADLRFTNLEGAHCHVEAKTLIGFYPAWKHEVLPVSQI